MSACPEAFLFREAEIAYSLLCMSTDYDSWHPDTAAVDVEMVMGHMRHNGLNARRAVEAILEALSSEGWEGRKEILEGTKWEGAVGVVTSTVVEAVAEAKDRGEGEGEVEKRGKGDSARQRLAWLFEGRFTE